MKNLILILTLTIVTSCSTVINRIDCNDTKKALPDVAALMTQNSITLNIVNENIGLISGYYTTFGQKTEYSVNFYDNKIVITCFKNNEYGKFYLKVREQKEFKLTMEYLENYCKNVIIVEKTD